MSAAISVPASVARGIVRCGSRTRAAGIVAHSMPSMANSAIELTLATSRQEAGLGGRCSLYTCGCVSSSVTPSSTTAACGTSLSRVVSTCTQPAARTPRRLMSTNTHTSASASSGGSTVLAARAGTKNMT